MSSLTRSPFFQSWKTVLVERFLGAALLLTALWLILFNQLQVEWSINPQYSYGWLMPFLGAYLLWRRWESRPEPGTPDSRFKRFALLTGVFAAFLLLPGRLLQEANPDWRLVSWWLAACVLTLTLSGLYWTGGRSWLSHFLFPFLFLILSVPWPTGPEQTVIQNMMQAVAGVTVEALNWCGLFASQRGNLIQLPSGIVGVDEACSGVRSLQSTLMASLFIGELSFLRWPRRTLLLTTGVVLAFILNCIRAFALAFFHTQGGEKSLEKWHDPAGYAILLISFGLLLLLAKWLDSGTAVLPAKGPIAKPRIFPALFLGILTLWLLLCETGTELWYRSHESKWQKKISWSLAWPEESEAFAAKAIPENVQTILRYNEGTHGFFYRPDGSVWSVFELVWHPGRVSAQLARSHSPEICMPASGARIVDKSGLEQWQIGQVTLPVQLYTFQAGQQIWYVYYIVWEDRAEQKLLDDPQGFYGYRNKVEAVLEGRRHLGQRVVQVITTGYSNPDQAKSQVQQYLKDAIRFK